MSMESKQATLRQAHSEYHKAQVAYERTQNEAQAARGHRDVAYAALMAARQSLLDDATDGLEPVDA